jgi:nitrate reductase alpha subunit
MRVYVKDGKVVREEQAGTFKTIEEGVPDYNPMGSRLQPDGLSEGRLVEPYSVR